MKNVRIWFKKDHECRYISHLDLNRTMLRALHKSKIPVWHTEGFNPHPFATFPLPLSLGFRGDNECMDVRLEVRVFDVTEPLMKAGKIAFASFTMLLREDNTSASEICAQLRMLMDSSAITVEKKSKKGIKTVDIKPGIRQYSIKESPECAVLDIILSAGSSDNVNPNLLITALQTQTGSEYEVDITRNDLYNSDMELFR